jgi:hypothetical protein
VLLAALSGILANPRSQCARIEPARDDVFTAAFHSELLEPT